MTAWTVWLNLLYLALAALAGYSLAKRGVVDGRALGAGSVQVWRWRFVWQSLQIRQDKVYFQAVLVAA